MAKVPKDSMLVLAAPVWAGAEAEAELPADVGPTADVAE